MKKQVVRPRFQALVQFEIVALSGAHPYVRDRLEMPSLRTVSAMQTPSTKMRPASPVYDLFSFVGCFFSWLDPKSLRAKRNRTASNVGLLLRWSVCVDDVDPVRQRIYWMSDEVSTVER